MFEGYRLKINDKVFPDSYIAPGSWKCNPSKRKLIDSYLTADGTFHELYYPGKVNIKFSIREHFSEEHDEIARFFSEKNNVRISFWNDNTGSYDTRICSISDIEWATIKFGNKLIYSTASVSIIEY